MTSDDDIISIFVGSTSMILNQDDEITFQLYSPTSVSSVIYSSIHTYVKWVLVHKLTDSNLIYGYANRDISGDQTGYNPFGGLEVVIFSDVEYNVGDMYNSTSGVFTCTTQGVHQFSISVASNDSVTSQLWYNLNGARAQTFTTEMTSGLTYSIWLGSTTLILNQGDQIDFRLYSASSVASQFMQVNFILG